jgi:hypothetical protein
MPCATLMVSPELAADTAAPIVEKQPDPLPTHSVAAAADEPTANATPQHNMTNIRRTSRVITISLQKSKLSYAADHSPRTIRAA